MSPARRRAVSHRLTWIVIGLQSALLLTLWVTPSDPPSGSHLMMMLWAWMHRPTFYPLVALLIGGPTLSWVAWQTPGRHRTAIVLAWCIFLTILLSAFGQRVVVMLRVLWWHVNR
jgi:hypothetical protein